MNTIQMNAKLINFMTCKLYFNKGLIKIILTEHQIRNKDYNQMEAYGALLDKVKLKKIF